jgi:hypothetical protein
MKESGYVYHVELPSTAVTAAKTLVQIKAGAAALELLEVRVSQITKTASELLEVQILRKTAAATVTSFTPLKVGGSADPASLAVGGTSATGNNASAEGTNGDILFKGIWNVLNGEYIYLPTPEDRIWVPQAGIIGIKLNTAPAASMNIICIAHFVEYQ